MFRRHRTAPPAGLAQKRRSTVTWAAVGLVMMTMVTLGLTSSVSVPSAGAVSGVWASPQVAGAGYDVVNSTGALMTIEAEIDVVCFITCRRGTDWEGPGEHHVLEPGQKDYFFVHLVFAQENKLQVWYDAKGKSPRLSFIMYGRLGQGIFHIVSCPDKLQCDINPYWSPPQLTINSKAPKPGVPNRK